MLLTANNVADQAYVLLVIQALLSSPMELAHKFLVIVAQIANSALKMEIFASSLFQATFNKTYSVEMLFKFLLTILAQSTTANTVLIPLQLAPSVCPSIT